VPLIYAGEVIGVLNINSSNYFVGGVNNDHTAMIDTVTLPSLSALSSLAFAWRKLKT